MHTSPLAGRLPRLIAAALLLLALLALPATAKDAPDAIDDTEDVDAPAHGNGRDRATHPSRGTARLATGEVTGRLAPAVPDAGEEVTVHAVTQLFEHPGQGGGRPDHAGGSDRQPTGSGRPDHAGPPTRDGGAAIPPAVDADGDTSSEDDETDTSSDDLDVTFTVDYGDGSAVEDMQPTKTRGRDGSRRAIAHHVYAEEGVYTVTITAIPRDGETATIELVVQVGAGSTRLEGDSRIETAVAISQDAFPDDGSAEAVLLARADQFADALAASTLAFVSNAPVLLTGTGELPDVVIDEIDRVLAEGGPVFLLGGESAISTDVEQTLIDLGYPVVRLSDDDRIGTALAVAQHVIDGGLVPDQVVVAAAGDFPDALAGAAYAAANGGIVLLTDTASLDDRVGALIASLPEGTEVIVAGGESAISAETYAALELLGRPTTRVAGDSRYDTAALLAELGYAGGDTVVLATGTNYPDALAGAVYAAQLGAPVLLVGDDLPAGVADFLTRHAATLDTVVTLGGAGAVDDDVIAQAMALVAGDGSVDEVPDTSSDDA